MIYAVVVAHSVRILEKPVNPVPEELPALPQDKKKKKTPSVAHQPVPTLPYLSLVSSGMFLDFSWPSSVCPVVSLKLV